jgi:hypothetical protein
MELSLRYYALLMTWTLYNYEMTFFTLNNVICSEICFL